MSVREIQPINANIVEMVCKHLECVQDRFAAQPETDHVGLLPPRHLLISDAVIEVIRSSNSGWHLDDSGLTAWQLDSVILWAWEQVHLEMLSTARSHVDTDYARSIRALGHVARPVPHRVAEVPLCPDEHDTNP